MGALPKVYQSIVSTALFLRGRSRSLLLASAEGMYPVAPANVQEGL